MTKTRNRILVLYIHPRSHKSTINSAMLDAVKDLEDVTVRNLYDLYPDFNIDVTEEQRVLQEHDIIIFQHPFYWYSSPALLKEWIDLVLEHGFAYGREGNALRGKKVMTATTTGGSIEAYSEGGHNRFTINQFLAPFNQTVRLCKMDYLPPFILHGALLINEENIRNSADDYKKIVVSLRDAIFSDDELMKLEYINHILH